MSPFARRITGVVAVVVLAAAVVVAIARPSNPFAERHTYWVEFDTAHGLGRVDRDVRVAGVKVGTIGEVERDGDEVRVEVTLTKDITLHEDARARMRPHTIFEGSAFVDLQPGSPSAPVIDTGDTIPREQTTNYVSLDQALRVLRKDVRENIRTLARVGAETFRDEGVTGIQTILERSPALMASTAPAVRAAQGTNRTELAGAVRGLSRTATALAFRQRRLRPLVQRTDRTAAALGVDAGAPLDATLAALPGTLEELRRTSPQLVAVLTRTARLSRALTPALPVLTTALRRAVPIVERTLPVARQATPLIRDARLIAMRLVAARSALVEMFGLTEPSLDKFDTLFGVFNAPTKLGAPSGVSQLVGGAFAGLNGVFRPYQTRQQNPTAPGHTGRLNVYVEPTGLLGIFDALGGAGQSSALLRGGTPAPCARVATVSSTAAPVLRSMGVCR
jgi:virulence factor Mce-like protein